MTARIFETFEKFEESHSPARIAEVILDYVHMCERFGALDFAVFVEAWKDADAIARSRVEEILRHRQNLP